MEPGNIYFTFLVSSIHILKQWNVMSENTEYDHKETKQLSETKRPGFGEMSESVQCFLYKYDGLSLDARHPQKAWAWWLILWPWCWRDRSEQRQVDPAAH